MGSVDLSGARRRAATVWSGFTSGQKTMLALAVVLAVAGGAAFTRWAAQPAWTPLYSNLPTTDAGAITQELDSRGVAYRLADGGATVLVPRESVYQLRLDLSAKSLPAGGSPGYALLDKQGITTSEFRQRVDFQRALEGELARTIGAIEGVESADVHLVIPADDLFTDDASRPSASVLLHGARGVKFSPGQVRAIVHLVASSVEGLTPDAVTVADSTGRVLSAPGQDGAAAGGEARAAQTSDFESDLAARLEEMLIPVTGPGRAVVRVSASLDFDERSVVTERFDNGPDAPVLSESTSNEEFTGPAQTVGGILGPDGTPAAGGGGATDYKKDQAERTFAIGKVTEQVKSAPGQVERLSVAVLLDEETQAQAEEVAALVSAAAGLDPARGDVIEVRPLAFDRSTREDAEEKRKEAEAARSRSQVLDLARAGGVLLIIVVVLLLAWRSARRSAVSRYPVPVPTPAWSPGAIEAEAAALLEAASAPGGALAAAPAASAGLPAAVPAAVAAAPGVTDEIGELIDRQPEEVAQILRGWLADRRS